jgi:hypothetical protein
MSDILINGRYSQAQVAAQQSEFTNKRDNDRYWLSNPRVSTDPTWEIITVKMRSPATVNSISFSLLNVPQNYEVYGTTTSGVRFMLLDVNQKQFSGKVSGSVGSTLGDQSWVPISRQLLTMAVTSLEFRVQRRETSNKSDLYSLGIRDILIKNAVHSAEDSLYPIGLEIDSLGNVVRRQIKQWGADLAVDSDSFTMWRSAPQPSPNAVVNFYVTVSDPSASDWRASRIDRIWIDPTYTGCTLNVYYSNDDNIGVVHPQPMRNKSALVSTNFLGTKGIDLQESGSYQIHTGALLTTPGSGSANFPAPKIGWIGLELDLAAGLTGSPTIFQQTTANDAPAGPVLTYNTSTGVFSFDVGGTGSSAVASSSVPYIPGTRLQIVCAVSQAETAGDLTARLVVSVSGSVVSDTSVTFTPSGNYQGLAKLYSKNAELTFPAPLGLLRAAIIKIGTSNERESSIQSFITDPYAYLRPQAGNQQKQGGLYSSPLDNAVYVGEYTSGVDGYGGVGEEFYTEKMWTPIWMDWITERGFLYLPAPIYAKHLKFEFSHLVAQPYPIHEEGVTVPYLKFPDSAITGSLSGVQDNTAISNDRGTGVGLPRTLPINRSINSNTPRDFLPKTRVFTGSQIVSDIRNQSSYDSSAMAQETALNGSLQAASANNTTHLSSALVRLYDSPSGPVNSVLPMATQNDSVQDLLSRTDPTRISDASESGVLGSRTPGWWTLPGGELRIGAEVMDQIVNTSTSTEKPVSSSELNTKRTRFINVSVHRYETATATRDAAIAYFAGLREVQIFQDDYTVPVDSDKYVLPVIDESVIDADNSQGVMPGTPTTPVHGWSGDPDEGTGIGGGYIADVPQWVVVAQGSSSGSYGSTDDTNWSFHPTDTSVPFSFWYSPTNKIFAGTDGSSIEVSTDGVNWNSVYDDGITFNRMVHIDTLDVFIGIQSKKIVLSRDGQTWDPITLPLGGLGTDWSVTTATGSTDRIIVAGSITGWGNAVAYSDDLGETWSVDGGLQSTTGSSFLSNASCWSSSINKFVLVTSASSKILLSADGQSWTMSTPTGLTGVVAFSFIGWFEGLNLFCAINSNDIVTSSDALAWTTRYTLPSSSNIVSWSPALEELATVCTFSNADESRKVFTSSDGISWTATQLPGSGTVSRGIQWGFITGQIPTIVATKTFNSVGTFNKVAVSIQGSAFESWLLDNNSSINPLGLNNDGSAFWSSDTAVWSDTVANWGASSALVGVDLDSNLSYRGRIASKVFRAAGVGAAGVCSAQIETGRCLIRICVDLLRPAKTGNIIKIQLEDTTPISGSILKEFVIDPTPGVWTSYKSSFFDLIPADASGTADNWRINLILDGTEEETIYVSSLFDQRSMTSYEISNDDGGHFFQAVDIVNEPNKFLVFPTADNRLVFRITMYRTDQYVYGITVTPVYLY